MHWVTGCRVVWFLYLGLFSRGDWVIEKTVEALEYRLVKWICLEPCLVWGVIISHHWVMDSTDILSTMPQIWFFPPIVWKGAIFLTSDKQWLLLSNISLSKFPLQHCVVSSYAWDEDSADTRECFHISRLHSMPPSLLWLFFLETLAVWSFLLLPPSPCPRESPSLCLGFHFRTRASLTSFGSHLAWISVIPWPENQLMKVLVSYNLPFFKIISVC